MRCVPVALLLAAAGIGCGPPAEAFCGLPSAVPTTDDVAEGVARAALDGADWEEPATYSVGPGASFVAGTLTIDFVADEAVAAVEELVGRGAFPVCLRLGARAEDTMSANLVDEGLVTSGTDAGAVTILDAEGDTLVGRFAIDFGTRAFTDGVFRATKR